MIDRLWSLSLMGLLIRESNGERRRSFVPSRCEESAHRLARFTEDSIMDRSTPRTRRVRSDMGAIIAVIVVLAPWSWMLGEDSFND